MSDTNYCLIVEVLGQACKLLPCTQLTPVKFLTSEFSEKILGVF